MPLQNIVIFKCNDKLKAKLEDIATELGVSKSAIARNTLALAIIPPRNNSMLAAIIEKIKKEARDELYVREEAQG